MENIIGFIGSNFRNLYVEDIYRLIALPEGYVIHYRYQDKYIDKDLLSKLKDVKNEQGIVFYYYNPKYSKGYIGTIKDCKEEIIFPIRKVIIRDIDVNDEIGQVNFFLELKEFVEIDLYRPNELIEFPKNKGSFVFELVIPKTTKISWLSKVEVIKDYFKDIKFFHIKDILGKEKRSITYDEYEKRTSITLMDESTYVFEILTYDKTEGESQINIINDENYININDRLEKGTKVNSKKLTVETRPIDFKKNSTRLEFNDETESNQFSVNISVKIKKKLIKSVYFGIMSAIVLFGFQFSTLYIRGLLSYKSVIVLLVISSIISLCLAGLHRFFNKK